MYIFFHSGTLNVDSCVFIQRNDISGPRDPLYSFLHYSPGRVYIDIAIRFCRDLVANSRPLDIYGFAPHRIEEIEVYTTVRVWTLIFIFMSVSYNPFRDLGSRLVYDRTNRRYIYPD